MKNGFLSVHTSDFFHSIQIIFSNGEFLWQISPKRVLLDKQDPIMDHKYVKILYHHIVKYPALFPWESFSIKNLSLIEHPFFKNV